MKQWYAKELAKLAQVSVRTLHHYDKIGLLKPSLRQDNNYRLYSEKDLSRLQQIIALKFFGFELAQIKLLLNKDDNLADNLSLQSRFLKEKAESLMEASAILDRISLDFSPDNSIPWKKVIELIEVYKMTQLLEDAWVKEIFTPEELKEYAQFESELKSNATPEEEEAFKKNWYDLVEKFKNSLHENPESERGIELGKQLMDWVNHVYGRKYAHLRTKKFEQGFAEGKGLEEHGLTTELVDWMDKAMNAYLRQCAHSILNKIGKIPASELRQSWESLMDEICGEQVDRKSIVSNFVLTDEKISQEAKDWLKSIYNI